MNVDKSGSGHTSTWVMALALVAAFVLFLNGVLSGGGGVVLYFPDSSGSRLVEERHTLKLDGNSEETAQAVLAELLLGPMRRDLMPLFSGDVRLLSIMERSGNLYVDLSAEAASSGRVSFPVAVKAIESSLHRSVPGSGKLIIAVDGREARPR